MRLRILLLSALAAVLGAAGAVTPAQANTVDVYATPGVHLVNGRYWRTTCSAYSSSVIRCQTDIFATKLFQRAGTWYTQNDWVFNNLSYLPSPREMWAGNPLASTTAWTSADGRQWRTECDTAATGRGACRSYIQAVTASLVNGKVETKTQFVFNNMVRFSAPTLPWIKTIPAAAPPRTDVPVAGTPYPVYAVPAPAPAKPAPAPAPAPVKPPVSGSASPISAWNCPSSHPIKGNASSMIYHMPGQRYYTRTKPEVCFSSESAAKAAGYRKSKV